jgi:hypothetical protein
MVRFSLPPDLLPDFIRFFLTVVLNPHLSRCNNFLLLDFSRQALSPGDCDQLSGIFHTNSFTCSSRSCRLFQRKFTREDRNAHLQHSSGSDNLARLPSLASATDSIPRHHHTFPRASISRSEHLLYLPIRIQPRRYRPRIALSLVNKL